MNPRALIPCIILLGICIAIAGCTTPQAPAPAATTAAQPAAAGTAPATSAASLVPGQTDSLGARSVNVLIDKDYLGKIHVTFQGGPGLKHVKKIDVTLNRADGQVKTATIGNEIDNSAELEGTKQTDRVMVFVTLDDGKSYKIFDDLVAYKPRP